MKTIWKYAAGVLPLWLGMILFTVCSCSVDDDPEPEEEKPFPPNGQETEITESAKTVGSSGGELVIDSLTLQIPPGTFSGDEYIAISVCDREHPLGGQEVTELFEVRGIPEDFQKPIRFVMKHDSQLEEESYLAMGMEYEIPGSDSSELCFDLLDASDSSGYLVGEWIPSGRYDVSDGTEKKGMKDGVPGELRRFFKGVTGFRAYKATGSPFVIIGPASLVLEPRFLSLSDYLLGNYRILSDLIHQVELTDLQVPERVHVFDNRENTRFFDRPPSFFFIVMEEHVPPGYLWNECFTYTISKQEDDIAELNLTIGKALFESYQRYIFFRDDLKEEIRPDWFSLATAAWIGEKFLAPWIPVDDYFPPDLQGLELAPFREWNYRQDAGMAPLIKYLEKHPYGVRSIFLYHEKIHAKVPTHEALPQSVAGPIYQWFPEFIRSYMEDSLYHVPGSVFAEGLTGAYDLLEPDVPISVQEDYQDLHARIFRFNTHRVPMDNSTVSFSASCPELDPQWTRILVFSIHRTTHEVRFITDDQSSLSMIRGVKELSDQGKDLLMVVVNSSYTAIYKRETPITLTVTLATPFSLSHQKFSAILDKFSGEAHFADGSVRTYDNLRMNLQMPENVEGQFEGYLFKSVWKDYMHGFSSDSGHVSVLVEEESENFRVAVFDFKNDTWNSDSDLRTLNHMIAIDIPLFLEEGSGRLRGRIEGSELKQRIGGFTWKSERFWEDGTLQDGSYEIKNIRFTDDSFLEVYFSQLE